MAAQRGTVYPLSAPMGAGLEVLSRLGLNCEASMANSIDDAGEFSEVLISAHAPLTAGELRLNFGATDDGFREQSIAHVIDYIDKAHRYPHVRQVNMHPSPKQWLDEAQTAGREGDYNRMIDGIRRIADHAAASGIEIVLENNNIYWPGVPDDALYGDMDWSGRNISFGSAPDEWIAICEDVSRPNVALCLDSSHACTYAHSLPQEERAEAVMGFLAKPELIRHVHWNDNYLYDLRGRNDSHAVLSKGSMPLEMHRAIKGLDATLLIEHFYSVEELEEELDFIASL